MKKTRFTEEQMVKILREADAAPVAEVAKKHGISGHSQVGNGPIRRNSGMLDLRDAGPE